MIEFGQKKNCKLHLADEHDEALRKLRLDFEKTLRTSGIQGTSSAEEYNQQYLLGSSYS